MPFVQVPAQTSPLWVSNTPMRWGSRPGSILQKGKLALKSSLYAKAPSPGHGTARNRMKVKNNNRAATVSSSASFLHNPKPPLDPQYKFTKFLSFFVLLLLLNTFLLDWDLFYKTTLKSQSLPFSLTRGAGTSGSSCWAPDTMNRGSQRQANGPQTSH